MSSKKIDPRFNVQLKCRYKAHPYIPNKKDDPEYFIKITEPGQAISIKKLVERYEKNRRKQSDFGTL